MAGVFIYILINTMIVLRPELYVFLFLTFFFFSPSTVLWAEVEL